MGVLSCLLGLIGLGQRDTRPLDSDFMERFPIASPLERGLVQAAASQSGLGVQPSAFPGLVFLIKWR